MRNEGSCTCAQCAAGRASLAAEWVKLGNERRTRQTLNLNDPAFWSKVKAISLDETVPNSSPSAINTQSSTCGSSLPPTIGVPKPINYDTAGGLPNKALCGPSVIESPIAGLPAVAPSQAGLPTSDKERKRLQIWTYQFDYFPDAFLAELGVAIAGNEQHNPGQPLHWAREKSTDHLNTAARHQWDHGRGVIKDTDGQYHLAKAIWRLKAALQLQIEADRAN
jgi:hypothetical protein